MPNEHIEILKDELRTIICGVVDKIDEKQRKITFCISSEEVDRHGEVVTSLALAKSIPAFAANPIACPCHLRVLPNGNPPTVGHWEVDSFKQVGKKSYMDLYFSTGELGEKYWQEYINKHMRACSISFYPINWHEEKTNKKGYVVIFDEIELREISPVAIGANTSALAKELGLNPVVDFEKLVKESLKPLHDKLDAMFSLMEEHIDNSDRSDFGDQLLLYGNKQSEPNKQNAELDVATAKQIADAIRNVKI